jgi:hypothetical protein
VFIGDYIKMTLRKIIHQGLDLEDSVDNLNINLDNSLGFHHVNDGVVENYYNIRASNTCRPTETNNITWDYVKIPIVAYNYDTDLAQSLDLNIYGITNDGEVYYLGQELVSLNANTSLNQNILFNLRGCSNLAGLYSTSGSVALPTNLLTDNQATGTDTLGNTTGFTGRAASIFSSNSYARSGTKSIYTVTAGATYPEGIDLDYATVSANTTYILHFWARGSGQLRAQINEYNGGTFLSNTYGTSQSLSNTEWRKFYVYVTTGASTNRIVPSLYTPSQQSATVYADEFYLATGSDSTNGYMNSNGDYIRSKLNLPMRFKHFDTINIRKSWLGDNHIYRNTHYYAPTTVSSKNPVLWYKATYNANMQTDFDDLRFAWFDGVTELPYWLHKKINSTSANFFIQMPIASNETSVWFHSYYGDSSLSSASDGFGVFRWFDDFEDGAWSSRSLPYENWNTLAGGTPAIESSSPISGTYSLKHTGDGTSIGSVRPTALYSTSTGHNNLPLTYTIEFDFKSTTQSGTYSPWINLWYIYFEDSQNWLKVDTYWHSAAPNQMKLRIQKCISGTTTTVNEVNYNGAKLTNGTVYHTQISVQKYATTTYVMAKIINGSDSTIATASGTCSHTYMDFHNDFTPFIGGVGANESSVIVFDNFRMAQYGMMGVSSTVGPETNLSGTIDEIPDENSNSVFLTVPYDWISKNYGYIEYQKYNQAPVRSKLAPIPNNGILKMLYENLDNYNAIRVCVDGTVNGNFKFNIPNIEYGYLI